jgi:adenylyltransferase/sulfurtransferase
MVPSCAEGGVMGVLPGVIGSLQAMETVKLLLGLGDGLVGRLLLFDALEMTWREVRLRRNPDCPVCGDHPTQDGLIDYEVFCGVGRGGDGSVVAEAGDGTPVAAIPEIDAPTLATRLASEEPPFLLDVREPWEWAAGNLEDRGARLIPIAELGDRLHELPRDRDIVVVCRVGERSAWVAGRLLEGGFPRVANLRDGLKAWAAQVDPDLPVA